MSGPAVERLAVATCKVPTDEPEPDGTAEWEATTIVVVVEASAGGATGLGYTYPASRRSAGPSGTRASGA